MTVAKLVLAACLLLAGCGGTNSSVSQATAPDIRILNASNPGAQLDLSRSAVAGKITVFEFYSDHCRPCLEMSPFLQRLAEGRPDLAIRKLNIDRPGSQQIDFESPLFRQAKIQGVPAFMIYDAKGNLVAEGQRARDQVREWFNQSAMIQKGQADPGTREVMKAYESPTP